MSCSDIDLKGYLLGELSAGERELAERHLPFCAECREEADRLEVTQAAMLTIRDEEIPRRIAFVSDKVFEPSWWQRLWQSGPRLGFASAAMLSMAILVHGVTRPAPEAMPTATLDAAAVREIVEREVAGRLETAVGAAVTAVNEKNAVETARLLTVAEERFDLQRRADMLEVQESFEYLRKQMSVYQVASSYREVGP